MKLDKEKYNNWQPGRFLLGSNYQRAITEIIADALQDTKAYICYDTDGELDPNKVEHFNSKIAPHFVRQAKANLWKYERHCTRRREENGLTPFNWALETRDRVYEQILSKRHLPAMRNMDPEHLEQKAQEQDEKQPFPGFPVMAIKKDYQTDNHPLALPTPNPRDSEWPTEWAHKQPTAHVAEWHRQNWLTKLPRSEKPILKRENIEQVCKEMEQKLQGWMDDIAANNWDRVEREIKDLANHQKSTT